MNYCKINDCDIANGIGVRVTLFVSGCTNRCPGCFQPETWDFDYGQPFDEAAAQAVLDKLAPDYIDGLTLLGGDPLEPRNQHDLLPFVQRVRACYPQKTIWAFTGFRWEELLQPGAYPHCAETAELLTLIDVLVDGRYEEALKDITLRFRGSGNQRILDLAATRRQGRPVLWQEQGVREPGTD
ncbi:MAG: anaerobic ribonucleoside-triphosphate reductase activating protein [Anaerovoracaceae bacterium]|jgi:anaerobic ribonucleoside-triphosphate reductase activating protein